MTHPRSEGSDSRNDISPLGAELCFYSGEEDMKANYGARKTRGYDAYTRWAWISLLVDIVNDEEKCPFGFIDKIKHVCFICCL